MAFETLQQAVLNELRALDDERVRYQLEHPSASLGMEDPDVRRLIEALAYSAVRTRQATMQNLFSTWKRLLSGYFHFILQPLPAMAMVQALVTPHMTEPVTLTRGSSLQITTLDGAIGNFQTTAELRVVPINLARTELQMNRHGYRLVMTFLSIHQRADDLGAIPIHINYLDNYQAALRLHYLLQKHLHLCSAFYEAGFGPDTVGVPCDVTFGSYYDRPYEDNEQNPLSQVRSFFHFPVQDLMIQVKVPKTTQYWNKFYLCFDLNADFPKEVPLYREVFHPFSVPVINHRRAFASPIECDGTKDEYPIRYLESDPSYVLERVMGVYRTTSRGLEPLGQAALGSYRHSYEVEEINTQKQTPQYALLVRRPEAFAEPQQLLVDALWYQPYFATQTAGPVSVTLLERIAVGVDFRQVGLMAPPMEGSLRTQPDRLLQLLSMKMKPVLGREDLLDLLAMFGSVDVGPYAKTLKLLGQVFLSVAPDTTGNGSGIRHVYELELKLHEQEEIPLLVRLVEQLTQIFAAWDYEARVEVKTELAVPQRQRSEHLTLSERHDWASRRLL